MIFPVREELFRRLASLQVAMATMMPHNAGWWILFLSFEITIIVGLNPKGMRALKGVVSAKPKNRTIADGSLIFRYNSLSFQDQKRIAQAIGMMPDSIMQDLADVQSFMAQCFSLK